jgi:hypothetical protein
MSSRRPFRETKKREEGENKHTDFQMVEWVEKGRKTEELVINNSCSKGRKKTKPAARIMV